MTQSGHDLETLSAAGSQSLRPPICANSRLPWRTSRTSRQKSGTKVLQISPFHRRIQAACRARLKEYFANTSALDLSKLELNSSELIEAVIADFETAKGRSDLQGGAEQALCRCDGARSVRPALALQSAGRSRQSSMPTHLQTQLPSKLGYAASVRKWQRLLWRAASSGLEALKVSDAEKATLADNAPKP